MPREFPRKRRVSEQLKRELARLIRDEMKDPRVVMASVTEVDVSSDLRSARVFISTLELAEDADRQRAVDVLNHAGGFLRGELGRALRLRRVPELHFLVDDSLERGSRLSALIDEVRAQDRREGDDG
jgi:ribosome-binding factor A